MMKLNSSTVFLSLAFLLTCSKGHIKSKLFDDTSEPPPSAESPSVSVQVEGKGNLAYVLDPIYWYNGKAPKIPQCGPASVPDYCVMPSTDDKSECEQRTARVQRENWDKGFYLERIDNWPYCQERCSPPDLDCQGIKCIGDGLSYAGKKVLEWTQACHAACNAAIDQGYEFPYECKNLNDNPEIKALDAKYELAVQKISQSPEMLAKRNELAAIQAETEKLKQQQVDMEKATAALPAWIESYYTPEMKRLVAELQKADDEVLLLLAKLNGDLGALQGAFMPVYEEAKKGPIAAPSLAVHLQKLEDVKSKACLVYDFGSPLKKGEGVVQKLKQLTDFYLQKVEQTGSRPLMERSKIEIENFHKTVQMTPVHKDLLSGSLAKDTCFKYTRTLTITSLTKQLQDVGDAKADVAALLAKVNEILDQVQGYKDGTEFQLKIREKASQLAAALNTARIESRWNKGQRLAIEVTKMLYLVFIPSIELNSQLVAGYKPFLIQEITSMLETPVIAWNAQSQKLGVTTVVFARTAQVQRLTKKIKAQLDALSIDKKSVLAPLIAEKFANAAIKLDTATWELRLPTEQSPVAMVKYDDNLSELEAIALSVQQMLAGVNP
jgi:hypothetical protein